MKNEQIVDGSCKLRYRLLGLITAYIHIFMDNIITKIALEAQKVTEVVQRW